MISTTKSPTITPVSPLSVTVAVTQATAPPPRAAHSTAQNRGLQIACVIAGLLTDAFQIARHRVASAAFPGSVGFARLRVAAENILPLIILPRNSHCDLIMQPRRKVDTVIVG